MLAGLGGQGLAGRREWARPVTIWHRRGGWHRNGGHREHAGNDGSTRLAKGRLPDRERCAECMHRVCEQTRRAWPRGSESERGRPFGLIVDSVCLDRTTPQGGTYPPVILARTKFLTCIEKFGCEVSQSICEIVDLPSPDFSLLLGFYTVVRQSLMRASGATTAPASVVR